MKKKFTRILAIMVLFLTTAVAALAAMVNINTADVKALATISGIGPQKATAIIEYRTKVGPFAAKDDLLKVKGIGKKTLEKISDQITVKE